jgi:hypothetical protein
MYKITMHMPSQKNLITCRPSSFKVSWNCLKATYNFCYTRLSHTLKYILQSQLYMCRTNMLFNRRTTTIPPRSFVKKFFNVDTLA